MSSKEVLDFLLPQMDEPLQVGFLFVIVLMMGFTMVSAHLTARAHSWEKKWNSGTADDHSDDLDIEHGSVTDLWHAVATAPEKLAEIMPGMLLVVGLLGTFLGLGLALNHASHILGQPNALSASGAASSMQDLMGLLQGLGTKFKTSTWGITGFVLLKIWSELTRFEEKRLIWVIGKVKTELEHRKKAQAVAADAAREALFCQINDAANKISHGFSEQIVALIASNKSLHQKQTLLHQQSIQDIRDGIGQVHAQTLETKTAMQQFTQSTQSVVENMAEASQRMADGADKVGDAATELVGAIETFKSQFTVVLDNVRKDLGSAIHDMSSQASETLARGSAQLGDATREISTALGILSEDVKETMNAVQSSINNALDIQRRSANEFTLSSRALNENISATTEIVGKLADPIKDGLVSVATSNRQMSGIGKSLDTSIKSMEEVVAQLLMLSGALEPLKNFTSEQLRVLQEIQGLRLDLVNRSKPAATSDFSRGG